MAGITGDDAPICIPAQQTIPLLVRWMLVSEDVGALCFGRALPRKWIGSGQPIGTEDAPTRWGRVDYRLAHRRENQLLAAVRLLEPRRLPDDVRVTFRVPEGKAVASLTVNGRTISPRGRHKDVALFSPEGVRNFEVVATMS